MGDKYKPKSVQNWTGKEARWNAVLGEAANVKWLDVFGGGDKLVEQAAGGLLEGEQVGGCGGGVE
jgi:hypothetical protein